MGVYGFIFPSVGDSNPAVLRDKTLGSRGRYLYSPALDIFDVRMAQWPPARLKQRTHSNILEHEKVPRDCGEIELCLARVTGLESPTDGKMNP